MERTLQIYTWKDHLLNISLVLFFILPQNELLYYFIPAAMIMVTEWKKSQNTNLKTITWLIIGSLAITLFINALSPWANSKSFLKMIEFVLLLACFGRLRRFVIIKEYLIFLVLYLLTFQFAYQWDIPQISQFMKLVYPLSEEELAQYAFRESLEFSDIGNASARLGGIYYNSNNCASFLEMLFVLIINERKQFSKWLFVTLLALVIFGIISTGSRTALLVLAMLMIIMLYSGNKTDRKYVVLFFVAGVIFFMNYGASSRMLLLREGMDNSFLIKVGILADYLASPISILRLLFGCLSGSYLVQVLGKSFPGTDFDIGDVSVAYGLVFDLLLLFFICYLYKYLGKYKNFLCILVWCFSNTIFMSYRGSALFFLIASIYYSKIIMERSQVNHQAYIQSNSI